MGGDGRCVHVWPAGVAGGACILTAPPRRHTKECLSTGLMSHAWPHARQAPADSTQEPTHRRAHACLRAHLPIVCRGVADEGLGLLAQLHLGQPGAGGRGGVQGSGAGFRGTKKGCRRTRCAARDARAKAPPHACMPLCIKTRTTPHIHRDWCCHGVPQHNRRHTGPHKRQCCCCSSQANKQRRRWRWREQRAVPCARGRAAARVQPGAWGHPPIIITC